MGTKEAIEVFRAKALEICQKYGITQNERLEKWLDEIIPKFQECPTERESKFQSEQDWLELIVILSKGKGLQIQDSLGKTKKITSIQKDLLKKMVEGSTDVELKRRKRIADFNLRTASLQKGRKKNIPFAGSIAWFMQVKGMDWMFEKDVFRNETQRYCFICDMIFWCGGSPDPDSEWSIITHKEKSDKVKYWMESHDKEHYRFICDEYKTVFKTVRAYVEKLNELIEKEAKDITQADVDELSEYLEEINIYREIVFSSDFYSGW